MDVEVKQENVSSWLDLHMDRACEWCSSPDYMRTLLPSYLDKPLDEWQELLLDLCYCYDCVQEYHRLAEELIDSQQSLKKKFQALDIDRLTQTIRKTLEYPVERKVFDPPLQDAASKLQVPLMEMLRYPYFLHHEQLAALFKMAMITLNQCGSPLKLEEKLPGAYLLLVHPDPEVRGWAVKTVRGLGLINPDDYDVLMEVVKWLIGVVNFNLFDFHDQIAPEDLSDIPFDFLPPHLFMPLTKSEYWLGLFVLLRQIDASTVQSCFLTSDDYKGFLETIVSPMESQMEEEDGFWPMLGCFAVLLERLGDRIWQMPSFHYKPGDVFKIITTNGNYTTCIQQQQSEGDATFSQDILSNSERIRLLSCSSGRFYKTALAWFRPFVQSLLDFDSGGECVSEVVRYLHDVADGCSRQSLFRHEVLSTLLRTIHELLNKRLFPLLVPSVRVWARVLVDVAIFGAVDRQFVGLTQRCLQHLLKACHRLGLKNALKYWDLFNRQPLPRISQDDQQEIIALVIKGFEIEHQQSPLEPVLQVGPRYPNKLQELLEFKDKTQVKQPRQGTVWTQDASHVPLREIETHTTPKQISSSSENQETSLAYKSAATKSTSEEKIHSSSTSIKPSADLADKNVGAATSTAAGALDGGKRERKIDPTVRFWGKAGPSTRVSDSEDDDDEQEHWAMVKRQKKQKHPFGNVKMSRKSLALKWKLIQPRIELDDCRRQIKTLLSLQNKTSATTSVSRNAESLQKRPLPTTSVTSDVKSLKKKDLATTSVRSDDRSLQKKDVATGSVSSDAKSTEVKVNNMAVKGEPKSKQRFKARKSAGGKRKHAPSKPKGIGATSEDPIVLSDDEDSVPELEKPFPKEEKDTEINFSDHSTASDNVALVEMMNEYESASQTDVLKSHPGNLKPSLHKYSIAADISHSTVFKRNAANLMSVETASRGALVPKVKKEKIELFTERFLPEVNTETESDTDQSLNLVVDNDINESSGNKEEEATEGGDIQEDKQIIPETIDDKLMAQTAADATLSSISKQLENDLFVDDGMSFWGDYYGYSELILNSQDSALASIEDDLEDLHSTQTGNVEERNTIFSNADDKGEVDDESIAKPCNAHFDKALPGEDAQTVKAVKHVSSRDDSSPKDAAASSSKQLSSQAAKPAKTAPSKALTDDEFFHEILSWIVAKLGEPGTNERAASLPRKFTTVPPPEKFAFDSMDQYYDTFKPLLFMEIWEQITTSWWDKNVDKKRVFMDVLDGSNGIISSSGYITEQKHKQGMFPLESDLVLVRRIIGDVRGSAVFGFVEKAEVKTVRSPRRVSIGSSGEDDVADMPKIQLTLNIKTTSKFRPGRDTSIQVDFVTSMSTPLRQWRGMAQFNKSLLASDLLKPRKADYFCLNDYQTSSHVLKEYNESQEKVISTAAHAMRLPFPIPRICLVQGPPGTGKSYTIVGLVKEILNRPQELPTQSATGPPNGHLANKVRILLCAPSNAAIDELIGQLVAARISLDKRKDNNEKRRGNQQSAVKGALTSKNCGDLCLVRVGRKTHIHPSCMKFWLDDMAKNVQEQACSSATAENVIVNLKEDIKECERKEKELERRIWQLVNTPHPDSRVKLKQLEDEKAALKKSKNSLQDKYRAKMAMQSNRRRVEARIKREILASADIVCTTLSGAGSTSLKQDLQLAGRRICPFTCVIVDEACQSTELDLLIPLQYKASKLVLVGDPEQLRPTVKSQKAKDHLFGRSMFQRLYFFFRHHDMGKPVLMLEEQFRMHPEIASFPSRHVYSGRLKSHSSLEKRPFPLTKHYVLFDVHGGQEMCQDRGSVWNPAELDHISDLCRALTTLLNPESVGIITPYRKQKVEFQRLLQDRHLTAAIEVHTVDGFQGREKDVIILSCVRAQNDRGSIGFVGDKQRMNVALTRARHALYIFGHMESLKAGSKEWRALIEDAQERRCIFAVRSPEDVQSILAINSKSDSRSSAKDRRVNSNLASATGRDYTGASGSDLPLHRVNTSGDIPMPEDRLEDNAAPAVNEVSDPRNQRPQSATVDGRENASVQTRGETSSRGNTTSMNSANKEPSSGNVAMGPPAEGTKNSMYSVRTDKQVKHGHEGARHTYHHRERERSSRHRYHHHYKDRNRDDRHHGNQHNLRRPRETDAARERHRHQSSNREHHRFGQAQQDRTQELRHEGRPVVAGPSIKRPKPQDGRVTAHSAPTTSLHNKSAPVSTGFNRKDQTYTQEMTSSSERSRSSATSSAVPASTVSNGEGINDNRTFHMGGRECSSPAESDQSSATTSSSYSNSVSNGDGLDEDGHGKGAARERHRHHSPSRENHRSGQTKQDLAQEFRHHGKPSITRPGLQDGRVTTHSANSTSMHSNSVPASTGFNRVNQMASRGKASTESNRFSTAATSLSNGVPARTLSEREARNDNYTFHMGGRERSSPTESSRSPSATSSSYSNLVSNEVDMDADESYMGTQDYKFTSILENNRSFSATYFTQLRQHERRQSGRSPSETVTGSPRSPNETFATDDSIASPRSPTESAVINARGFSTVASQSTSSHPLAMSWPSVSHSTHSKSPLPAVPTASASQSSLSRLSSSFTAPSSSIQHASLADSHSLGRRSSAILDGQDSRAQEVASAIMQRHPPTKGPPIIPATRDLVHRWNNLHGGSRKRKAHAASGDVSSLRERAGGANAPHRQTERSGPNQTKIFKKKVSENFRGRKSWDK